jgi:GDP-4-dehydro-6-deoxy-D-mannose reductase
MRVLITGASGFAGGWLARACAAAGDEVIGVSRNGRVPQGCGTGFSLDLRDGDAFKRLVAQVRPGVVHHLAALSSVGRSWEDPGTTLNANVAMAVAVLEAVRLEAPEARVVWVSSCEVYGVPDHLPVSESAAISPESPYAVSKAAGEMLAAMYAKVHGLAIVRVRPFNHSGPGQLPIFLLSSLARQAAEARLAGVRSMQIETGNPDTRRDFTDVRDVGRAYRLLAGAGVGRDVYNICSGTSVSAAEQVATIASLLAPIEVEHVVDPERVRPHEVLDSRGCADRIRADTGWSAEIQLRQTIAEMIEWWESELSRSPG